MKAWRKWLISIAATVASVATLAACGGSSSSNNDGGNSVTSEATNENQCTVKFDTCTTLTTNKVSDKKVEKGDKLKAPILVVVGENPGNAEVIGWYIDPDYTTEWNFETDTVQGDMTLYAKWSDSHAVIYYLGDETETEFYRQLVKDGDFLQREDALSDGYQSEGFFADPEHTIPFDFTAPITGETKVYIHRSESIYFTGDMIARRFTPKAAMSGAGSTTGTVTAETNDKGETYAKMNFGYSTAADPHMLLENVTLDITKSQKLRITFKNLGKAQALSLYFVAWNENNKCIGGYENFAEQTCVRYYFTEDQKQMSPDGEWATVELDMAAGSLDNGVSLWGNASTLIRLRFQMGYISTSPDDLSNEIWVKSIEGIADDSFVGTSDSAEIQALCVDDAKSATDDKSATQQDVAGWIFPKDYANVKASGDMQKFNKTEGLLMYAPYDRTGSIVLNTNGEDINLDELTTLKIRLKNFGYATKLTLKYKNKRSRSETVELAIDATTSDFVEYKLNLFGANDYEGLLETLTITYQSVGVDNAILIESITFEAYESKYVAGFNFDDKYFGGAESNEQMELTYNSGLKGTKFDILQEGASFEKAFDIYSIFGYKNLELNYKLSEAGVTALKVELTVGGQTNTYVYDLVANQETGTISLPLERTGYLENAKFTFEGTGTVVIKNLKFTVGATDIDFSNSTVSGLITEHKWSTAVSYDNAVSATLYGYSYGAADTASLFKYYPGVIYSNKGIGEGNIPLEGKTKISIVYQNRNAGATYINVALGLVDVSMNDWQTAISEPYSDQSGGAQSITIKGGMSENEWAHVEIDLTKYRNLDKDTLAQKAIACLLVELGNPGSMYIRSISLIDGDSPEGELEESFDVNYFVGNDQANAAETQQVAKGGVISELPNFEDGQTKVLGYFADAEYTIPFDFSAPITAATNIYVQVEETLYLGANWMYNNFSMTAAAGSGSLPGTLELAEENGESYAKINYGYSVFADPFASFVGSLDITKSQKLAITFKYLGKAESMALYFVAQDENGNPVGGSNFFSEATCVKYYFKESEKQMSADGEWVTVVLDMAGGTMQNGVSLWGTATTLTKLRFQVSYASQSQDDLSNEIWVKSIEGIEDATNVTPTDSQEVQNLLENDNVTETDSVAASQASVNGWIFPKNFADAQIDNGALYNKANGLVMYTTYGANASLVLSVPNGVNVSLDDLTTLTLKLKNLGYAGKLVLTYTNKDGKSASREIAIDTRMSDFAEYKFNLFGADAYEGVLDTLTISYESVGVDNAIIFESIVFSEFESMQVVGINYNDKNFGGAVSTAQMNVSYNADAKGTSFEVLESGASYTKSFTKFSTLGYKNIVLNYSMAQAGVTAVKVGVTIGGATQTYTFAVSANATSVSLPLSVTGSVQSMSITFEGTGEITLQNIVFAVDSATAIDFSTSAMVDAITREGSWYSNLSYSQEMSAAYYSMSGSSRIYLGALYNNGVGSGCLPLTGKTKVVLVYQNRGASYAYVNIGLGLTTITNDNSWKRAIAEVGNNSKSIALQSGMAEDEWATVEIDLTQYSGLTNQSVIDTKAASCVYVQVATTAGNEAPSMYVRAISFI